MKRGGGQVGVGVRRGGGDRRVDMRDCTKTKGSRDGKGWDVVFDLRRDYDSHDWIECFISHALFAGIFSYGCVLVCMHMSCFFLSLLFVV